MPTITLTVKATGEVEQRSLGRYRYVRLNSASAPVQISFDGNSFQVAGQNDSFGPLPTEHGDIYFKSQNALAATITVRVSNNPFTSQDTAQSNKPSTIRGNLGIAIGAAAAGGLPACDANGFLQVTNNMQLVLTGLNASGARRQVLYLSMATNSPASLNVLDSTGAAFITLASGAAPFPIPSDAAFTLSGATGVAWVTIGEIFLANA